MTSPPRLAVVILTWNGRDDTLACLASLRGSLGPADVAIVVDNGSTDGTEGAVLTAHPWVEFRQTGSNRGYAGGNNVGLRRAIELDTEWTLLLNNDTVVPQGALDALIAHAALHPEVAAFQPLLVSAADESVIDSAGHVVFRCPGVIDGLMGRPVADAPSEAASVFGACGAAALLRTSALARVGLLDEEMFVLCEDVDLMFRLRLAGGDVQLVPAVRVLHKRGVSGRTRTGEAARRRKFWLQRNSIALAIRYWPATWLLLTSPIVAFRALHALWLSLRLPGQRCLPLWTSSFAVRSANRRTMRRLGLDVWFERRP